MNKVVREKVRKLSLGIGGQLLSLLFIIALVAAVIFGLKFVTGMDGEQSNSQACHSTETKEECRARTYGENAEDYKNCGFRPAC